MAWHSGLEIVRFGFPGGTVLRAAWEHHSLDNPLDCPCDNFSGRTKKERQVQKVKSIKLSFCSLLEQNGMDPAPFHSLELGQVAGRSALLRSCKDHRLSQHSLLASFSLCHPATAWRFFDLFHPSLLSARHHLGREVWVPPFPQIHQFPALSSLWEPGQATGGFTKELFPSSSSMRLFFTVTGVWMHPCASVGTESVTWTGLSVLRINHLYTALVTHGCGAWSNYPSGLWPLGCACQEGILGWDISHWTWCQDWAGALRRVGGCSSSLIRGKK